MVIPYAILDASGVCINRTLWDGTSNWRPPDGCTAVPDPDNLHPLISQEPPVPTTPIADWKLFWDGLLVNPAFVRIQQVAAQELPVSVAYTNCAAQLLLARQGDVNLPAIQACLNQLLGLMVGDLALTYSQQKSLIVLARVSGVYQELNLSME